MTDVVRVAMIRIGGTAGAGVLLGNVVGAAAMIVRGQTGVVEGITDAKTPATVMIDDTTTVDEMNARRKLRWLGERDILHNVVDPGE